MDTIKGAIEIAHKLFLDQKYVEAGQVYNDLLYQRQIDGAIRVIVEFEYSWVLYRQKKYQEAIALLTRVSTEPELNINQKFDATRILGFSYLAIGNNISSIDALTKAIKMDVPEEEKKYVLFELGKILFIQGDYSDSLTNLLNSRLFFEEEDFYYSSASFYIGFIYIFQNNLEDAFNEFIHLTEHAQTEELVASGLYGMAHLHFKTENYKGLLQVSKDITSIYPDFHDKETIAYFITKAYFKDADWINFKIFCEQLFRFYPNGRYQEEYAVFKQKLAELEK